MEKECNPNQERIRMAKYCDTKKCRHETEVSKYKKGELAKDRHIRRLQENKERLDVFKKWCKDKGFEFRYLNNGEHWQVKAFDWCFDWWPRTAKLVIDQNYKHGIHVHDIVQFMKTLDEKVGKENVKNG